MVMSRHVQPCVRRRCTLECVSPELVNISLDEHLTCLYLKVNQFGLDGAMFMRAWWPEHWDQWSSTYWSSWRQETNDSFHHG